ncbi:ankyrin repeat protein [Colletotrichum plurivorum]|uniref:Ankyrin repeat protein n=1 Tax=Colletotrichum plurivorum TaxID=2175906 RepID=A0A8H6JXP0_9PEZI|nr:ankyrin repeat protein [Colletotrichum plurivorum]
MAQFKDWTRETEVAVLDEVATAQEISPRNRTRSRDLPPTNQGSGDAPADRGGARPRKPSSGSHWDPRPGFAHIDGDVNGRGYNETTVDIVCVPCPGADPVETWARDPLPDGYFGRLSDMPDTVAKELAGGSILSPTINRLLPKAAHLWVRQGIRKEVSEARVLLYRHRELIEGLTLDELADDLIEQVWNERYGPQRSRPLFFIAHSVGGLVVELALLKATQSERYKPFMYNCHGITFFATPHRGSSYLSMNNLENSIQRLLRLQRPFPRSITKELRVGHKPLLRLHDEFSTIASELRIWTFYETIDSQLSGSGSTNRGRSKEVRFGAPIASIKSSLVGVRQERVFSLDSEHANCASFGSGNTETMNSYLADLAAAVQKATSLSAEHVHTPLSLKKHVKVEIIGFYEDPDAEMESAIRLYFTRLHLQEFLEKGPERCLDERLRRTTLPRDYEPVTREETQKSGLGILSGFQELGQKIWRARSNSGSRPRTSDSESQGSPPIVVTRPSMAGGSNSMPVDTMRRMGSLTVPPLSPPGFNRLSSRASNAESTRSDPTELELSPKSADPSLAAEPGVEKSHSEPLAKREERLSRGSALDNLTAGFSRPIPSARKFMWIHTPFTNPSWVKDVFGALSTTHDASLAKLFNNDNWTSKHVIGRHSQSQASFVKPACNFIPAGSMPSPHPSPNLSGRTSPGTGPSSSYLYLYMPFLHFDTYIDILQRRRFILRRMQHGRARPVPQDIAGLESSELRMIWEYIGYDPPLNYRRTLDQFAYPSLRDTWARDDDQMLYKLTKDRTFGGGTDRELMTLTRRQTAGSGWTPKLTPSSTGLLEESDGDSDDSDEDLEEVIKDGKVLMVDQLWLWAVDKDTLTTFFSKRESKPKEGPLFQQADLRNSVYNELNGDLTGRCDNALDLAAFIVLHAVTVLLDRTSHPDLEIFRIFEEAISMLTERMTSSLKRFRMQTFKDVGMDSDSDNQRPESIKKRHRRELQEAERENRENTSALMELRDLEDELKSLERLFEAQDAVVRNMKSIFEGPDLREETQNGRMYLDEALSKLEEYKGQTLEMLKRVDTTRNDYEKLLEMVQRQAQVDEVRWSRLQTELASSQNLSVMIFTTFTVIFLPLSFFTSLFGMNTKEWDAELPSISYVGAVSLPLSIFLIAAALVAAFSSRVQSWVRTGFKGGKAVFIFVGSGVKRIVPKRRRERRKKRIDREEREERRTRMKDRGYDFWATVRREKGSDYRIPEVNRKKTKA